MNVADNNPERNRPAEEGKDNDNNLRDDSGLQPGASTISSSATDEENNHLTRTAGDDFTEDMEGEEDADPAFDNIDDDDENA